MTTEAPARIAPALTWITARGSGRAPTAVRLEGGLFSPDLLEALAAADLPGQKAADFGLPPRRHLTDEIAAAFHDARTYWNVFRSRLARLPEGDPATSLTRDVWVIPFLGLLGYALHYNPRAYVVDGMTFAISHRADAAETSPPVHIVGIGQELGRLAPSGRPRLSPHALLQEYLNRSEALWGIVTNGRVLRLLRDSTFIRRQAYIEFDLEAIFEEERFADFVLLYRLLHRTRLPADERAEDCLLEQYYQRALEQGGRVREHLRDGVEACLQRLADGFLRHPESTALRTWLRDSAAAAAFYRELLRLVYRFLFLLVSEERGLISQNPLYLEHYSVMRLRRLLDRPEAYTDDADLWHSLRVLWRVLSDAQLAAYLDVPPLNGALFEALRLDDAVIANRDLLQAFWHLAYYRESPGAPPRRVNYAALDTEELGSVYESLLDYHPSVREDAAGLLTFELLAGSERKSTGSYYTPPQLVAELIQSALEPVLQERLQAAATRAEKEQALLAIKVLDPACGSGHFLLAAARRLGKELARIRSGEDEPAPEQVRLAVRDVVAHCLYGVDKNPLAVELCRVALWLESHAAGKPLTFLDHHIRCGDSLLGVLDLDVLEAGIPDEAFTALQGDDKAAAADWRRRNQRERHGQTSLFAWQPDADLSGLADVARQIDAIRDDTLDAVQHKRALYHDWCAKQQRLKQACDLWTAAFFQRYTRGHDAVITSAAVHARLRAAPVQPPVQAQADALAARHRFFHWALEFPEAFAAGRAQEEARGGFDVVLGNPPWEQIQLEEQEFFAARDAQIAHAAHAAERKALIQALKHTNPRLWQEYRVALHGAESISRFLRASGQYPHTGRGRVNTYSVFAERMRALLAPRGRAGVILPTGIATDDTNKFFFADLVERGQLVSLFDFENRAAIFPDVHRSYKFCLLTLRGTATPLARPGSGAGGEGTPRPQRRERGLGGEGPPDADMTFAFFCTHTAQLRDPRRVFHLTRADIARINPNTRTLPVFRTRQDAALTRAIYARVPVLLRDTPRAAGGEITPDNLWGVSFKQGLFNMSSDSHLFRTRAALEAQGYRLVGNRFVLAEGRRAPLARSGGRGAGGEGLYLPLYEAKMIWHYDHRFGTYAGVADRSSTHLPTPDAAQHADPAFLAQPWYWVDAAAVQARLGSWRRGWLLGFRNVTNATNERTAIFSLLPWVGVGHSMPLMLLASDVLIFAGVFLTNLTSLVLDWVLRQKIGGMNLTFFILRQLPVLPPSAYTADDLRFIVPRVAELVYTAWDLKPFVDDVWAALAPPTAEGTRGEGANAPSPLSGRGGQGGEGHNVPTLPPHEEERLRAALRRQWEENWVATGGVCPEPPAWQEAYPEIDLDGGFPYAPFKWDAARRAVLCAELDAYYARLYGLTRKQLRYILDPADLTPRELEDILDPWEEVADPLDPAGYAARAAASDFPGETFRVLKEKELQAYGEYRTRRLVLEAWARLADT